MELQAVHPNYLDGLKDELGIDMKDAAGSIGSMANIQIGKNLINQANYEIINYVYKDGVITGAMIKPVSIDRAYVEKDGRKIQLPNKPDIKPFFVSKDKLSKIMNQEVPETPNPTPQA